MTIDDTETDSQYSLDSAFPCRLPPRPAPPDEAPVVDSSIPLGQLRPGQSALISAVVGRPDDVHRLEEIGLRGGRRLRMVRPGSRSIIRLGGSTLSIRCDDRLRVLVAPAAETEPAAQGPA
jgi:ferrous iron transport protein A